MKIAICEDDPIQCNYLENELNELNNRFNMNAEVVSFLSGKKMLEYIKSENDFDVYLLDIEIGTVSGVDIARIIRKNDIRAVIVFITSHNGYMPEAFGVHAYNYISKPIKKEQISELVEGIFKYTQVAKQKFFFEYKREKYTANFEDIIYFQSNKRMIEITTVEGAYEFYGKIKELEGKIPEKDFSFIRSGCIINMNYIKRIEKNKVYYSYLSSNNLKYLEISRNYFGIFMVNYREFIKRG